MGQLMSNLQEGCCAEQASKIGTCQKLLFTKQDCSCGCHLTTALAA